MYFTDNQAAGSILRKGSRVQALHDLAVEIYLACQRQGFTLHLVWKRRSEEEMVVADRGSRGRWCGLKEFQLDFNTMAWVLERQEFTICVFATWLNRIVPRYYSKAAEVEAEGHNFFCQEWAREEHL